MFSLFLFVLLDSGEFSTSGQKNVNRLFAIQAVSAKVMRKVINNLPNTFEENMNEVKKHCKSNARQTWAKEFLSSNYTYFCFHMFKHHEK